MGRRPTGNPKGRPPKTAEAIRAVLSAAGGSWVEYPDIVEALPERTERAIASCLYREHSLGRIEKDETIRPWGNQHNAAVERSRYRL